jgi:hypothetical protein
MPYWKPGVIVLFYKDTFIGLGLRSPLDFGLKGFSFTVYPDQGATHAVGVSDSIKKVYL